MRKLILSVLLASSVAMPAMAQDRDDRGARGAMSEERREAREARRAERPERVERPERAERAERREARQQVVQRGDSDVQAPPRQAFEQQPGERRNWGQRRSNNDGMTAAIERQQAAAQAAQADGLQREVRREGRSRDGSILGRVMEQSGPNQVVVQRDRDDRRRSRYSGNDRRWNNHWRGDRNYDWRNYRHRNRSVYRLGRYWDPYGSSYRRFSIGFSLFPSYYRSNFWLNDPWQYRLPPAYGPYRWVRYYDDALLVNVYTGQVVDVEHNFFW